jgi:hypothetical protein
MEILFRSSQPAVFQYSSRSVGVIKIIDVLPVASFKKDIIVIFYYLEVLQVMVTPVRTSRKIANSGD